MRKQTNPNIKAHVVRGAFYLLLLMAVGLIPFALAQRASSRQSAAADPLLLGSTPGATLSNGDDPASGTWSFTGSLNTARGQQKAALLPNGKVLVAGGIDSSGTVFASAELYDPSSGIWTTTGNLNAGRFAHTATLLSNGMVLVAGGIDFSGIAFASAELYDPVSGTWTFTGSLNTAHRLHTATLLPNGMVLVAGGFDSSLNALASAELYDPASGTWTTTGSLNAARGLHTATLLPNGKVLAAGGDDSSFHPFASAELYDPANGTWTVTGSLNDAHESHTATLLPNEKVLVAGGEDSSFHPSVSAELYAPASGSWTTTGSFNAARAVDTATLLPNGMVLVAGGFDSSFNALASAELYTATSHLGNVSARAFVQTGDDVMIGGFIVQGTEPKRVIIRAIGPELTQHGVPNVLANPTLELHNGTGALIASNNNWATTIIGGVITTNQVREIQASGHAPRDGRESAIIADLPAGNYTAIVRGVNDTTGVALAEVYDLNADANSILGNISTRAFVQTDDNVMIGGFIVQGTQPKRVILRAIGPELSQYGVPNPLPDPMLELHDSTGALIASNDNWLHTIIGGIITNDQVRDILRSGYAPGDPNDSAIIAELPPGNYTAIVRGVNNTTGAALVEVYDLGL